MRTLHSTYLRPLALLAAVALGISPAPAQTTVKPLQTFAIKDHLRHQWMDEMVNFPISLNGAAPKAMTLADEQGRPVPTQISELSTKAGKVTGESSGEAREARITLPNGFGETVVLLDGNPVQTTRAGQILTLQLPVSDHSFAISRK